MADKSTLEDVTSIEAMPEAEQVSTVPVEPAFSILVDGQAERVAVPVDMTGQRAVTVDGQTYEVCATRPDGTWVYRAVAF